MAIEFFTCGTNWLSSSESSLLVILLFFGEAAKVKHYRQAQFLSAAVAISKYFLSLHLTSSNALLKHLAVHV